MYYTGATIMKTAGMAAFSWTALGAFGMIVLAFIIVQAPYYHYKLSYTRNNVHIRTDTGTPVFVDGDDVDGDGRGGDTLRRIGIID